jgi:hypothetical protein
MHTSAREEANLTDTTDELKLEPDIAEPPTLPEPETGEPELPEQEETALVPTEPEVIEGEVVEIELPEPSEADTPPKQRPYWLLIPFAIVLCLLFLAGSYLLPLLTPSATITIVPVEKTFSMTTAIQVHGRQLPPLTLAQSATVPATGTMHQNATRASGTITFFNGLYSSQTVASGTILTGKDGVQIIITAPAIIPAANPPYIGQVTISAHAMRVGKAGNTAAGDINQPCCLTAVKAVNTTAFTGGQNARDYLVVTRADIQHAAAPLKATLSQSDQAALHAQLNPGEALITPACQPSTTADHHPGDQATEVTVTVSLTCSGIAYAAHEVDAEAVQSITSHATTTLGTTYVLSGDIHITIIHAAITQPTQGIATLAVKCEAIYVYQLSPGERKQLLRLIVGKPKQQAIRTLLQFPGIAGVQITVKGGNQTLPEDPTAIRILVQYRAM